MSHSPFDTKALARRLNSTDEAERQQAQDELRTLIAADVRRIKHVRIAQMALGASYLLLFMPLFLHDNLTGGNIVSGFVLPIVVAFMSLLSLFSLPAIRAARRIAALDIPQAVGPLIEVHATSGLFRSRHVRAALVRLLPRLRPADADMLTPTQRKYLGYFLRRDEFLPYNGRFWGTDLKIAILRALEQIGDEKAFSQVEKVAHSAHDFQVRFAAQECLPFLQQRVQQTRIEQTLLRASTESYAPDILLRPASSIALVEPQTLLRASVSDANDAD